MSRSYKKNPVIKDYNAGMKTMANRKVRRVMKQRLKTKIANGNAYRKLFNPWDISDWSVMKTWREYQTLIEIYKKEYENGVCRYGLPYCFDRSQGMSYWDWFKTYKRK
ncbi:MAG: hypothetical protein LBI27_06855 [Clostridiales bacterium]|jgi:hypothetical protein|nr:hypothetical protein [Clostridiales bacterium]